jgi:putative transposase
MSPIMADSSISYRGCHFPGAVISHAVWLYLRFPLSFRNVEELLAERGIHVSYETVRRWVAKFGTQYGEALRKREARPGRTWHLDEMAVRIAGKQHWLWRAVDENGTTLDVLLQERRNTEAAERFFRRLLDRAGGAPECIITDKLASYAAAMQRIPAMQAVRHIYVRAAARLNNRTRAIPPANPSPGAPNAALQVSHSGAAISHRVQQHLQSLPGPASPAQRRRVPKHEEGLLPDLARGLSDRCLTCARAAHGDEVRPVATHSR